ncbi:MAG TPA: Vms1/Ankzf1 family peptidyl-tRNA hydrolase [Actinomycetota bacterium]|nr:Vms1/Ankzf1 family peptidyl-tRNA hydrolase [Actinomycetota bacterium]
MSVLERDLLRDLAEWDPDRVPVTTVYLTVDGRRYPRRADLEVRLAELLRDARAQASDLDPAAARSVEGDLERISVYVREELDRGDTRGIAMFSVSDAGLWESVHLPRPVRDRAFVGPRAELRMLEVMLETHGATCTALIDYEKARIFLLQLGRVEEVKDVWDEVPGRHDQGGRSQLRRQRHVDDHRRQHLKHVADMLFRLWKARGFENLVLAGPGEAHREIEADLHGYLRQRVRSRIVLPMTASTVDVHARTLQVEEELEREAERSTVQRLEEGVAAGTAVTGLADTLAALSEGRVGTLAVRLDLRQPGARCEACGRLSDDAGRRCATCGGRMRAAPDVVELAVATAYGRGCRVETVVTEAGLVHVGGIGALLRF